MIPMITKGNVTVLKEKSKVFEVWGKKVTLKHAKTFFIMRINGETVMSETPQETEAMRDDAKKANGRALVAGLGLGVILKYMRKKCSVIDVVEPNQDVIDAYLELNHLKADYDTVSKTTIEDFLESPAFADGFRYDYVYLDTWYGLDPEYLPHINWMYAKARRLLNPGGTIMSWGYDRMVSGHVRDCLDVYKKRKKLATAHPDNLARMKLLLPLLGSFADWLKQNPRVDQKSASLKALDMAMSQERCPVPLTIYKDWCQIKEAHWGAESFIKMMASNQADKISINIGGKIWRPA